VNTDTQTDKQAYMKYTTSYKMLYTEALYLDDAAAYTSSLKNKIEYEKMKFNCVTDFSINLNNIQI